MGDGQDIINHTDTGAKEIYNDTLVFGEGITQDQLSLVKIGNNLIIKLPGDDQVTFSHWFNRWYYQIDNFEFADGSTRNAPELVASLPITE